MTKTKQPLITIGITCYHEGEWLRECWESVLSQTDDRWLAVIVMDGGASPETVAVYEELEHPKLKKFRFEKNQGPYVARNKAFELTTTPYHFFLDADDALFPDAIEAVLEVFEFEPDVGYVSLNWYNLETNELYKVFKEQGLEDLIAGSNYAGGGAYSVEAWKKVNHFCTEPLLSHGLSDYDFHLSLVEKGIPRVHSGRSLYKYRVGNPKKISNSYAQVFYKKIEFIIGRHPIIFKNTKLKNQLLSRGYIHSSEYYAKIGDMEESKRLARLARQYDPKFHPGAFWLALTGWTLPGWYQTLKKKIFKK